MRFNTYINNAKCIEWGLNPNQGALFDLINQSAAWAQSVAIDGEIFYWISRNEVIRELPLFYSKSDTVYRHFVELDKKGLIKYLKVDGKDLVRLTNKGKSWNEFYSEINPNNSEIDPNNSEINPNNSEIDPNNSEIDPNNSEIDPNNSEIDPKNNNTNYKNTKDHNNSTLQQAAPRRRIPKFSEDDLKTAHWIFGLLQKLNPKIKLPKFEDWANDIRLINQIDKRSHREICELFQWANRDPFWQSNILSPAKLREKWDQLEIKRTSMKERSAVTGTGNWNTPEGWNGVI